MATRVKKPVKPVKTAKPSKPVKSSKAKTSEIKLTLDFQSFAKTVSMETDFIGLKTDAFTFKPHGDDLEISTGDDRRRICMVVEGDVSGFNDNVKGLSLSSYSLANLVKIRSKPKLLNIRARKDVAEFSVKTKTERLLGYTKTIPLADFTIDDPIGKEYVELKTGRGLATRLSDAVARVDIEHTVEKGNIMALWLRLDPKGLFVTAQSDWHMAHVKDESQKSKKRIETAIDKSLFKKLQQVTGTGPCSYHISDKDIVMIGDNIRAKASSIQQTNDNNITDMAKKQLQFMSSAKDKNVFLAKKPLLESLIRNLDMADDSTVARFSVDKDGKLMVSSETKKGQPGHISTQSSIDVDWDEDAGFSVNTVMFNDLLSCFDSNEEIEFCFTDGKLWSLSTDRKRKTTIARLVLLLQNDD